MQDERQKMSPEDVRKLQLIELEILLELDRICRKNDIEYFLADGTVLGAVRHKGFIPWDDDLDTRMARGEFEKFCKVCETDLDTERFFLQTAKTDSEYRWGYAKIRRKGTEYLREGQEAIKCMSGVSIDIFVIDHVPDSPFVANVQQLIRRGCIKTLWSVVGVTADPSPWKRGLYHVLRYVPKQIPLGIMEFIGKQNNKKPSKYVWCMPFYRRDGFLHDNVFSMRGYAVRQWFEERVEIEFEGFSFYVCKDYMEYMKSKYKNMWEYPPESQRFIHPPKKFFLDVEIDLQGRSVEEYMKHDYIYLTQEEWEKGQDN